MKQDSFWMVWGACVVAWGLGLGLGHTPALAQEGKLPNEPNGFTWGELSLLPDYCRDVQGVLYSAQGNGQDSPRAPYWVGIMGPDFWHMHHYCYGQVAMLRANEIGLTPIQKKYQWQRAVNEYGYVIKNSSSRTPLMPEVFFKLGEVQLLLENIPGAQAAFATSRSLKPDYWPAYTKWADVLAGSKQYDAALALVREGLRHAPEAKELQKRAARYEAAGGRAAPLGKVAVAAVPASKATAEPTPAPAATPAAEGASAAQGQGEAGK